MQRGVEQEHCSDSSAVLCSAQVPGETSSNGTRFHARRSAGEQMFSEPKCRPLACRPWQPGFQGPQQTAQSSALMRCAAHPTALPG